MSKRAVLTAIVLVSIGIVFGAVLVTSFSGAGISYAEPGTTFNTKTPMEPSPDVTNLNKTFETVAGIVTPQVVYIEVKSKVEGHPSIPRMFGMPDGEDVIRRGSGSGIILTEDGYILTNRHVVEGATDEGIKVMLFDSREFEATLVGEDENTDIAVIKIDATGLSPAALGNSESVHVGEWVVAVGNPLGLTSTVTAGIISAISRNIWNRGGYGIDNYIQTDAVINPGNSGGALVNLKGEVIGVNTAIAASGREARYIGYGFAVPINLAQVVADVLIKKGKFVRGYIGIRISDIDAQFADALGLDIYSGVLVSSLVENGAGQKAGLEAGDAIVEVDGKRVESTNQLQARVGMHHPGDVVKLKIWRSGKYINKSVTLQAREEKATMAEDVKSLEEKEEEKAEPVKFEKSGFTIEPLTRELKKQFEVESGVLVSDVKHNGRAWENNLRKGIVIFEVIRSGEKTAIENVDDFSDFAASLDDGQSVLLRVKTPDGNMVFIALKAPLN